MASEYGWKFDYILNDIRVDEIVALLDMIGRRKRSNALLSLQIAHNPYSEKPMELFNELQGSHERNIDADIDRRKLNEFKKTLAKGSKLIKVKE